MTLEKITFFPYVGKDIKPENYERVGHFIVFTVPAFEGYEKETEYEWEHPQISFEDFDEHFKNHMGSKELTKCNCCNHAIKRGVFFSNKSNGDIIFVGFDCANSIMRYTFDIDGAKKQTLAERKKRERQIAIQNIFAQNVGLEDALNTPNKIVREISEKFYKWLKISPKQVELVMKLASQRKEYEQTATKVPSGKIEGNFIVISQKPYIREGAQVYNTNGNEVQKTLLQHETEGWKVWGNCSDVYPKGEKINAKMNIEPSDKDPYFGFFQRLSIVKTKI